MKLPTLLTVVICSAVSVGCGQSNGVQTKSPPGFVKGVPAALEPEEAIQKLETPEDRVTYLHQLGGDKSFEPQKHAEMLEKYSKDGNEEVALAAKELLERK
ncbi:MAG TPA: hypothetical protein VFG04_13335 [Planctomycetaceae bacterium]|jgi:hypothetical protein|nr:hypothetical protein [Planctomycetaceae bacterium]